MNAAYCFERSTSNEEINRMVISKFQWLFSRSTWYSWLEKIREFDAAMNITEIDLLERRVRRLEAQVSELLAQVEKP